MADITIAGEIFTDVDFKDLETARRFAAACDAAKAIKAPENKTRVEMIIYECDTASALLDTMFGPGAAERVFRGRKNSGIAEAVLKDLFGAARQSDQESEANFAAMQDILNGVRRPSPNGGNREQRRAEAQGKHQNKKNKGQRPNPSSFTVIGAE